MEAIFDILSGASYRSLHLIVNGLWLGILLTGLTWLLFRRLKKTGAATGYIVWWAVLGAIIVLPVMLSYGPSLTSKLTEISWSNTPNLIESGTEATAEESVRVETAISTDIAEWQPEKPIIAYGPSSRESVSRPEFHQSPAAGAMSAERSWSSVLLGLLPITALLAWMAVSGLLLARLLRAHRRIQQIKRSALPFDYSHLPRLRDLVEGGRTRRKLQVCLSSEIDFPMAAGLGRPVVLIPSGLAEQLDDSDLENAVLHELAHLRRWDDWTKLAQKMVEALAFFHPAVRWISRQLDLQREIACDDIVVEQTGNPDAYARCLTRLAQLTSTTGTALVPGALTDRKQIFQRFHRILNGKNSRRTHLSRAAVVGALSALALTLLVTVNVMPVFALPLQQVTFAELSRSVQLAMAEENGEHEVEPRNKPESALTIDLSTPMTESELSGFLAVSVTTETDVPSVPDVPSEPAAPSTSDVPSVPSAPSNPSVPSVAPAPTVALAGWEEDEERDSRGLLGRAYDVAGDISSNVFGTAIYNDGDMRTVIWSDGGKRWKGEMKGDIELSDDGRSIKSISRRGYFYIYERDRSGRMELEVEPDDDGILEYSYWVDGDRAEFDATGQEWLAEMLLRLVRRTGIGAEKRIQRILETEGIDGVLDEIEEIESSYVMRIYFDALISNADLEPDDYSNVMKAVRTHLDSDYEKAELLISIADLIKDDPTLLADYVDVVESLDSDYETRRVLAELTIDKDTPEEIINAVLDIADRMDSDYEKAELMISMAPYSHDNYTLSRTYYEAVRGLDSDYETRRVLEALGSYRGLDPEVVAMLLEVAEDMDSDYEKAELLIDLADQCRDNRELLTTLLRASSSLDSDYEMRRVLAAGPYDCDEDPELVTEILLLVQRMDSDYEQAEMLIDLSDCAARDEAGRREYLKAVNELDSDYDTKRVLQHLIDAGELDDQTVLDILDAVEMMSSDYDKGEVLSDLVSYCRGNDPLENAFVDVIESMDSDYEINKLYAKLYRRDRRSSSGH